MKIRVIRLGTGKLDKPGFSVQHMKNIGVIYFRLGFFGLLLLRYGYDPVADLERKIAEHRFPPPMSFNRHQRRAMAKLARKHAKA